MGNISFRREVTEWFLNYCALTHKVEKLDVNISIFLPGKLADVDVKFFEPSNKLNFVVLISLYEEVRVAYALSEVQILNI